MIIVIMIDIGCYVHQQLLQEGVISFVALEHCIQQMMKAKIPCRVCTHTHIIVNV